MLLHDKVYPVQRIEAGGTMYRIFDETGEDYLYHMNMFEIVELECGNPSDPEWAKETWALTKISSEKDLKNFCKFTRTASDDFKTFPIYKFRPWELEKKKTEVDDIG